MISHTELQKRLSQQPRVPLAHLPTPLTEAGMLRDVLGGARHCPRILIKHDEMTGLVLGGSKARKLEYLMGQAFEQGAKTIITTGDVQSNHAVMTAAASRLLGFGVQLVLTAQNSNPPVQGNYLLAGKFGAQIHLLGPDETTGKIPDPVEYVNLLRLGFQNQADLYEIPVGGSNAIGALGYVACALELLDQLVSNELCPTFLYYSCGSRGTQAGLELGTRLVPELYRLRGIAISEGEEKKRVHAASIANEAASILGVEISIRPEEIMTDQSYIGDGFGVPTPESQEAAELFAQYAGVLLDQPYTAKVGAALIADVRKGLFDPRESIVFLHTGGMGSLFVNP